MESWLIWKEICKPRKISSKGWIRLGLIYLSVQNSFICSLPNSFFFLALSVSFTCLLCSLLLPVMFLFLSYSLFYLLFLWVWGTIAFNFTFTFYDISPLTVFKPIILYSFTFSWFFCLKPLLFLFVFSMARLFSSLKKKFSLLLYLFSHYFPWPASTSFPVFFSFLHI